jgi:hypothetical protein
MKDMKGHEGREGCLGANVGDFMPPMTFMPFTLRLFR